MKDKLADLRRLDLPFNIDEVKPQCIKCVRGQLKKYKNFSDDFGYDYGSKFNVPCTGIPKEPVDPALKAAYTDEEWEEIVAINNIKAWAKKYLILPDKTAWEARWYQEEVLECTSKRKVLRCSRRAGKTDLVCVEICYYLYNYDNMNILVAGPQKNHTEEIINRVRSFIQSNPVLQSSVVRDVSAPYYEIKLTNKSRVRGFAAGAKGGTSGVGIRGQDADRLYMEEMDYIDEKAITGAVLPILQTKANTALVGFSTPSGFKTTYRKLCEADPQYKEFFYDYTVLPHKAQVEADRSAYTDEEWTHEFLALFGGSEEGVYKPEDIESALRKYEYKACQRDMNWKYTMGIDWNEVHGAEFVVLGFNPFMQRFKVVEACVIEKAQFTQLASIDMMYKLNAKWRPNYIYADAGNGSTNFEVIMKNSFEERHKKGDPNKARLVDVFKKYDSGSSIEIKEKVTNEKVRVPAKRFMVNSSVRLFESQKIQISASDNILEAQLRNYIIAKVSPTKQVTYGLLEPKVKDHRLDALNLAIVAFQLEFSDLYNQHGAVVSVGAAPDPRKLNGGISGRPDLSEEENNPSTRRLDHDDQQSLFPRSHISSKPARLDRQVPIQRTMDPEEEAKISNLKFNSHRRRRNIMRQRPKRETF